jgi:hypothetical protein
LSICVEARWVDRPGDPTDWVLGYLDATLDEIVEISITLFNVVSQQYLRELAGGQPG